MSDVVLKVENLYKRYRLGNVDRQAFKEDLISFWAKLTGKPDPYDTYITSNELAAAKDVNEIKSRYVWSLQDINFEVKRGEVLGVIGKNGAGKSTLLKILSKTTAPTKGQVKVKGKIASLLEVGTGFHPELTGRENIYMNGAILGMTRHEITAKLDEIVAFAGIEAYIDTPVKRYSSGMYVRLAFAVAAHLEPDILIVDEVLAVGDAEFQKKCIGKMKDVSAGQGRTVLFVSHNMTAVKSLCSQALYLKSGNLIGQGHTQEIINTYLDNYSNNITLLEWSSPEQAIGNDKVKIKKFEIISKIGNSSIIDVNTPIEICYEFWSNITSGKTNLSMHLFSTTDEHIFNIGTDAKEIGQGLFRGVCNIPPNLLNDGTYYLQMMIVNDSTVIYDMPKHLYFEVVENRENSAWYGKWAGAVRPTFIPFSLEKI